MSTVKRSGAAVSESRLFWSIAVLLCVVIVTLLFYWTGAWTKIGSLAARIHTDVFAIVFIGLLGATGGALSASREGRLQYPSYESGSRVIHLGVFRELFFGAVGGYVLLVVTPGASEGALELIEQYASRAVNGSTHAAKLENLAKARQVLANASIDVDAGSFSTTDGPSVDLIELIALGIIGGYGGRWIVANSLARYVSPEQLKEAEQNIRDAVGEQRQRDHRALKLFDDQADITTPAPNEEELRAAIKAAAPTIHERIYVRAREIFNLVREHAAMLRDLSEVQKQMGITESHTLADKAVRLLVDTAKRLKPVMECLVELDPQRRYSGSRFALGLAHFHLGDLTGAKTLVEDAIAIASATKKDPVVRAETLKQYEDALHEILSGMNGPVAGPVA